MNEKELKEYADSHLGLRFRKIDNNTIEIYGNGYTFFKDLLIFLIKKIKSIF